MKNILKQLTNKKRFSVKAEGNSMYPVLHSGDLVYFKPVHFNRIKVNDTVIVSKNKRNFIHRVIYLKKEKGKIRYLITKGDNNPESDGKVYKNQVFGLAYQIKRGNLKLNIDDIYLIQSSIYFKEIIKIKKAFENAKIDYLILKGLPVHLYYEGKHPRRIYADCDILVDPQKRKGTNVLFKSMGYDRIMTELPYLKNPKSKSDNREITFSKYVNGLQVIFDIHFQPVFLINQISNQDCLYPEKYLEKITKLFLLEKKFIKINSNLFPVLSTENLVLYLALHFFHHQFKDILRLEFLDIIIQKSKLFSNSKISYKLVKKISEFKLNNFVYPTFIILQKYFNTKIRGHFFSEIKPSREKLIYLNQNILNKDMFCSEGRVEAGESRFKDLFYLSSEPLFRKIRIFAYSQVISAIYFVVKRKIILSLRRFSF